MDEKAIHLTDGTVLDVKVNFATLYYMNKMKLQNFIEKEDMTDDENMEVAARLIYVILRSNGRNVTMDEAMILTPMDIDDIKEVFDEFGEKVKTLKKKQQAKQDMKKMMK
ncbi:hypothetical protein [Roseburia sp. 831b]|uniref:hypothetical protein n=1 Tax=Roseburia sp. 831b TaxID=1261635 RepID=UPI00095295EB|nr:hypothetical protein [Roseburia sp. 831b]WVK73805.1 hypothetical protein BIV16_04625 [Roseburia sp. 831b]